MTILTEKHRQIAGILDENDVDLWLIFVRETSVHSDPILPLVTEFDVVWPSFFLFTRRGESIAVIGHLDTADFERSGYFSRVVGYEKGAGATIRRLVEEIGPRRIAVNYSRDIASADGLTHGMYLLLRDYLKDSPFSDRLVSAESVCSALRGRKTETEIDNLRRAAIVAHQAWEKAVSRIRTGLSEIEIAGIIREELKALGTAPSFPTIVNAGTKTAPGHGHPTSAILEPGELLHIDMGARYNGYCSDIQRLLYMKKTGENGPPNDLIRAFEAVRDIIAETAQATCAGIPGADIDALARRRLTALGYPEYQHALGHQIGIDVHDGGGIIGPLWEQYGRSTSHLLENGNVFTLELEITLPGIGCVGLEEDVVITSGGTRFLSPRQMNLVVKDSN